MAQVTQRLGEHEVPYRVRVIDAPKAPSQSSTLGLMAFLLIGFFGGIILAISTIIMMEMTDPTVYHAVQINRSGNVIAVL